MNSSTRQLGAGRILAAWILASACAGIATSAEAPPRGEAEEFFEKSVRPLLVGRCLGCHGGPAKTAEAKVKVRGGLDLSSRAKILEGGDSGPAIVPGNVEDSLLIRAVRYHDEPRMPPDRRLDDVEIGALSRWIEQGAAWPGATVDAAPAPVAAETTGGPDIEAGRSHWSFRPLTDPPIPDVRDRAWPSSPIDCFVLEKLEARGRSPARPASRRALIRRATFDLIGLPPTAEDVDAFEADPAPDAYARLIDRLLATPQYGERWGRRWLDLVRYADTAGETADYPVPEAYRYRDYVIDAFNADLPYDRFLAEQVAGDLLAAAGPADRARAAVIATGFIAVSRRFGFDPQNYHNLTIDDTIDALGKSVLGLTIACARCHDHKFDPIRQADYYALYGIFESTRYPFPGGEETKRPKDFVAMPPAPGRPAEAAELAYAVAESPQPADSRIQRRGDPKNLGAEVRRGFPEVLVGRDRPAIAAGSGRRELAAWLTDRGNPLTYRVLVNRVWQHHFGRGLVASASNFGVKGTPPSHPELLDWLASRFLQDGCSIKSLHRRILLSAAYQMASATEASSTSAAEAEADPENVWLGHFNRRRLDAEEIRDAILLVAGDLDPGRAPAHPFPPVAQWGYTQHAPFLAVYPSDRRSVYLMTQRIRRHPFLALFDGADPNSSTEGRNATTVPTQSLFFLNDPLVHRASEDFAARLIAATADPAARIDRAFRIVLGRPASAAEVERMRGHLDQCRADLVGDGDPPEALDRRAWASVARILFGTNEFVYVD
ncbi:PSD1 and planctomycete cytochrome C domain-containing protein [Paludisphaera mucosa]|uniref:PSD1 and planctomycete cytochrome C domain-containing protein n=1 Tax=Paludisphaera mucosa TaxID=3030827 RepID=A0ABT6FI69_9BACT|nr:PSD1 and planctomycete cytochrome C domain-containing protein [Paludisphaera mucosa]MDG3007234.1 PSD1 and planctomycete cytochrome C domain-containing protein [Paludisphaera mucosa]